MDWIFERLKQAREKLGLNQKEAAEQSGVGQKDISMLENAKREFIPNRYITFLYNKGIDLNTLFDETCKDVALRQGGVKEETAPNSAPNSAPNGPEGIFTEADHAALYQYEKRLKSLEMKVEGLTANKGRDTEEEK